MSLSNCGFPLCDGHLGKYSSCIDETLDALVMSGGGDESTGTTEFECHMTKMIFDDDEWIDRSAYDLSDGSILIEAGTYLICSDDRGFVWAERYTDHAEAARLFAEYEQRYAEWAEVNDC